jgi:hypothetical protein
MEPSEETPTFQDDVKWGQVIPAQCEGIVMAKLDIPSMYEMTL